MRDEGQFVEAMEIGLQCSLLVKRCCVHRNFAGFGGCCCFEDVGFDGRSKGELAAFSGIGDSAAIWE
jgi:hypothetical protein